ncbi:MAG: hypothetical protein QM817_41605 [Archangium sp.]
MGTQISPKIDGLIRKALANDGKIDAKEATAIAGQIGKKDGDKAVIAQRLMDDGFTPANDTERKAVAKALGQADMPKTDFQYTVQKAKGDLIITNVEVDGVKFKMALGEKQHMDPAVLKAMAKEVNAANALITDKNQKISAVAIGDGLTTRMATFNDKPMLVIDRQYADAPTVAHEAGHAVLESFRVGKNDDVMLRTADIYNRLQATKPVSIKGDSAASGMWPFDPSQWSKSGSSEHPWQNADEFFASAVSAWRSDRAGLEKAIAKFEKEDPAGAKPAREMLAMLDELAKNGKVTPPKLDKDAKKAAQAEVARISAPSKVEDTLALHPGLEMALKP